MKEAPTVPPEPMRNPATKAAFRRQLWLQIYLPLLAGLGVMVLVAVLLWNSGIAGASAWADASLILLLIPVAIFSVIPIVLLAFLVYGVVYLTNRIPVPAHQVQQRVAQLRRLSEGAVNKAIQPLIIIQAGGAAASAAARKLGSIMARKK